MKVLIDNIEEFLDSGLFLVKGDYPNGEYSRVACYWNGLNSVINTTSSNYKVITSGCVFILNYDKDTYVPNKPTTFKEYLEIIDEERKLRLSKKS